ncbi:MAG TPA: acyl-CoA dehydrogenase [Xanthobacteraceae bacterium]|nr:acyl-CoA dehydrogenase [Xanthobacteraceae bacterium]
MAYRAPVAETVFFLDNCTSLGRLAGKGALAELSTDLVAHVLQEAGKFAADKIAPLNRVGDKEGTPFVNGKVVMPKGWTETYRAWAADGWNAVTGPQEWGGQGLPSLVGTACLEFWNGANMAFGVGPMLTMAAIDALEAHGSDELKRVYLGKMVSGEWMATMQLTEPQAGSDLALLRSRATPAGDGSYRLKGTKIFITYGEHDMTANIVHFVLARLPDAPPGTKGISLFLVPKFMVKADGSLGPRNDLRCASIEHKMGIHGSPTCVMNYGDNEGATGFLVGKENNGLAAMFTMMNNARLAVGAQGVGVGEAATQQAYTYAHERKQGRGQNGKDGPVAIVEHPDVKRMLLTMRALTNASRAICLKNADALDRARHGEGETERRAAGEEAALLTPVAKAFSTDAGIETSSLNIQVHGGMGFIEETGAAQLYRDSRIAAIYEGTNGIQAVDLVTRKITLAGGAVLQRVVAGYRDTADHVAALGDKAFGDTAKRLEATLAALERASEHLLRVLPANPAAALAGATPYLKLFGLAAGGAYLADIALAARAAAAKGDTDPLHPARIATARFFAENLAPVADGLADTVIGGGDSVLRAEAALVA